MQLDTSGFISHYPWQIYHGTPLKKEKRKKQLRQTIGNRKLFNQATVSNHVLNNIEILLLHSTPVPFLDLQDGILSPLLKVFFTFIILILKRKRILLKDEKGYETTDSTQLNVGSCSKVVTPGDSIWGTACSFVVLVQGGVVIWMGT